MAIFRFAPLARFAPIPVLAALTLLLMPVAPAEPSVSDTPLCQTYLTNAVASMNATKARLQSLRSRADGELCIATRSHYLEVVKTRAVVALCKSGSDRTQDVGRLDAAIEELDDVIASRCSSS